MRALIAVFAIWTAPLSPVPQRPYLSCIDGHIVEKLSDCPPPPKHGTDQKAPPLGGGNSGLLGLGIGGIL